MTWRFLRGGLASLSLSLALAVALLAAAADPSLAQKSFVRDDLASDAIRLEETLRKEAGPVARPAADLRRDGQAALGRNDGRRAMQLFTAAIAAEPRTAAGWIGFARAAGLIEPANYSERYQLQQRRTSAAYAGYQRAATPPEEAASLVQLAQAYAVREVWRPALDAYRASLALADDRAIRATYEDLRGKHGFRALEYKVDSDSAAPRVCFQFSEALAGGKTDFTPFVAVSGAANAAIETEGQQLCVDGLKHGQKYAIVLRQGLPSGVGEALLKSADYEIYVRDRSPQVRFSGRNYVLPTVGQQGIPVVSVNTGEVAIDLYRIGDRNLLPTLRSSDFLAQLDRDSALALGREKGVKIWSGSLATASDLNRDVVTAFPVLKAIGKLEPGVYVMTARPPGLRDPASGDADADASEGESRRATQWFVVSDLGLTALKGADGVNVLVRSLADSRPVAGAEIRLVAKNNEILATKASDAAGRVTFDPGLARGEGGSAPGLVVATAAGGDYTFLDLNGAAFDLTDRGVKGRALQTALDAFLFTERGVYRSGETVNLTALLRDRAGGAVAGLPLTLVVKRPDGVEQRREQVPDAGLGGRSFSVALMSGSMRGTWRVQAYLDPKAPAVGEAAFLVEDYVPERLELTLAPKSAALRAGEPAAIDLSARYLYGAPGAGLDVSGQVVVGPAAGSAVKGLEGFSVGLGDEQVEATTVEIEDAPATGPDGRAVISAPVQSLATTRPVEAKVVLRVAEPGGRAVERSVVLPVLPDGPVLGIRKNFAGDLAEGAVATFDVVLAAPDGARLARSGVSWSLYKVERSYQWFNSDGRWGFEPVKSTRRVADGRVDLPADGPGRISSALEWGEYRLDVSADGIVTGRSSISFTAGFGGGATADTPDLLEINLDKGSYRSGEEMRARVKPRFAGRATLAIVTDGVKEMREVEIPAEGATVSIPVKAEWGSGAYLVATAFRPLDGAAKRMPGRALGLAWFEIDRSARDLAVTLSPPAKMRPRERLAIPVKLGGLAPGEEAYVTVAAVDVGILNLTRYETPDPAGWFFGQKQIGVEFRDLYGYLIDGMGGNAGAIRSGGDGGATVEGSPPTQEPLARYSGVVRVGPDGAAEVAFDIPAFNGTVRVMAAAWSRGRVGSAQADVVVRDPVVVTGSLPRFLSVGDRSRLRLDLDNVEGRAADYTVELDLHGPVLAEAAALRQTLRLAAGAKGSVTIPIAAAGPGDALLSVRLTGPEVDLDQSFRIRIQPGTPSLVRRDVRPLEPGASLTVSADLLADILPGTGAVSVSVSPLAALDVPGLLQALDRYPYGCSEQVVSRAMPLLYVNRLAAAEALGIDRDVDERVRGAIERVLSRQQSNGAFGLWSAGGDDDVWLDAYVTDFLTRARELKFTVPAAAFGLALEHLRNFVANTTEVGEQGDALAYASYVLARNGRPVAGDLRYLADTKLAEFAAPLARAQLAAALGLIGDRGRAQTVFASAIDKLQSTRDGPTARPDYGTRLRDGAGLVALASEVGSSRQQMQPITRVIEAERTARGATSTQENAWMVLAAVSLSRDTEAVRLDVGGTARAGAFAATYKAGALEAKPVRIANSGSAAAQIVVNVTGNPIGPEPADQHGYAIERSYYKLDGTRVEPAQVRQNDRFVTVLKVTEPQALRARVLVVDRLPAGFEIDNPKLVDSGSVAALDWLKTDVEPLSVEYRDDRFVAALDRQPSQPATFTLAYTVRAVAPGRYVHPAATVEDMYRPDRFGRTAFGTVEVAAKP